MTSDQEFIEQEAKRFNEREMYYRSIGMYHAAVECQQRADYIRARQLHPATFGTGVSNLTITQSDGTYTLSGDMDEEIAELILEDVLDLARDLVKRKFFREQEYLIKKCESIVSRCENILGLDK